jgi:O-antigen/teichoic acid export membrane protein
LLQGFLTIRPLETRVGAMRAYVPLLLWNRGVAFLRLLLVAKILGAAGKPEFGRFQIAIEFINWIVPLALLGTDSIAERYAAKHMLEGNLKAFITAHFRRVAVAGAVAIAGVALLSPWLGTTVFAPPDGALLAMLAGLNIGILAWYQWVAATLRGLRAYQASAGMETIAAGFLLLFSTGAAFIDGAPALLIAYAISSVLPLLWFGWQIRKFVSTDKNPNTAGDIETLGSFGMWSQIRLMLAMTVGFLALWGVEFLSGSNAAASARTADYSISYRIAQILLYVGATLWSSTYALAARKYSAGSARQARYQYMQIGKAGGAALLVAGTLLVVIGRGVFPAALPEYSQAVGPLLAPMVGLFFWYGLIAFLVSLGDLHERPHVGAVIWAIAVVTQIAGLLLWRLRANLPEAVCGQLLILAPNAQWAVLCGSITGAGLALVAAYILLRQTAALRAIYGLALAGAGFFFPGPFGAMLGAGTLLTLAASGVLMRRAEWRRIRSFVKMGSL